MRCLFLEVLGTLMLVLIAVFVIAGAELITRPMVITSLLAFYFSHGLYTVCKKLLAYKSKFRGDAQSYKDAWWILISCIVPYALFIFILYTLDDVYNGGMSFFRKRDEKISTMVGSSLNMQLGAIHLTPSESSRTTPLADRSVSLSLREALKKKK